MGPIITPTLKVMGNKRKALDWYLICVLVISSEMRKVCLLLLSYDLRYHRPHDSDVTVQSPADSPEEHSLVKRLREAEA